MAEKAIIGKMSLYETMTMIVPGAMIVFCVWLLNPKYWMHFLDDASYTVNVNYLYDIALIILMFVLVYVAGFLNYLIVDWLWRLVGLRNNICMLKNSLQNKQDLQYENIEGLIKERSVEDMTKQEIEDIYYEAYTYTLKKNGRSNIPFLENQVAMLKGLIFPMSGVVYLLCPEPLGRYRWLLVIVVVIVLIVIALYRQKKTINLVLEDYEYFKRIAQQQ